MCHWCNFTDFKTAAFPYPRPPVSLALQDFTSVTAYLFALMKEISSFSKVCTSLTPYRWSGCNGRTASDGSERACKSQVCGWRLSKAERNARYLHSFSGKTDTPFVLFHTFFKITKISVFSSTGSLHFNLKSNSWFALQFCLWQDGFLFLF